MILNLSAKSLKNTCKEICILESFSVFMNKIFEIYLWSNSFFQFTIFLVTFVIVHNAPLLKCVTLVSVNWLLETSWYFCLLNKNFLSKQRILPFLSNPPPNLHPPPFSRTAPFLEKIFYPHTYCQIRGTQSPLCKGGFELCYQTAMHGILLWYQSWCS